MKDFSRSTALGLDSTGITIPPITVLLLMLPLFEIASSAKILLMPLPSYSHVNPMTKLGEILLEGGHEAFIFLPHLYSHMVTLKSSSKVKIIEYPIKAWEWNAAMHSGRVDTDMDYFDYVTQTSYVADLKAKGNGYHLICKAMMANKVLDRNMKQGLTFDLAIVDAHPLARCNYAMLYKLGIPYVSYMQEYDPWLVRSPALPSYVPAFLAENLTDRMTFWERIVNFWTQVYWSLFASLPTFTDDYVTSFVPDKPPVSIDDLIKQSRLWLSDTNFLLDYSRPVASNEVLVSLSMMREPQTLPKPLEAIANNASTDGIIIISLDQNIPLPSRVLATFMKTFKIFHTYQFFWQHPSEIPDDNVPSNVKDMVNLPMNSLLGHPKAKLLVTSGNNLDQNTALYHGVPVLCFPLDGHQRYNAKRSEIKKYGSVLSPQSLTIKSLHTSIKRLLTTSHNNETEGLREASAIMKINQPSARKDILNWMSIVLRSNLTMIQPYALEMPWHRYLLVDIAVLVSILLGNVLFLVCNTFGLCYQKVKNTKHAKKIKSDIVMNVQRVVSQNKATVTVPVVTPLKNIKQQ